MRRFTRSRSSASRPSRFFGASTRSYTGPLVVCAACQGTSQGLRARPTPAPLATPARVHWIASHALGRRVQEGDAAVGVGGDDRIANAGERPAKPAVAEALRGLKIAVWHGLEAPAKLPTLIFARQPALIVKILEQPDIPQRIRRGRLEIWGNSSEQFRHYRLADPLKWAKFVVERCEGGLRRRESGSKIKAARAAFVALAHPEIRCQTGSFLFFRRGASIDAVHAQAPPREPCHDLRSHRSARATGTAAGSEACPALARWLRFLAVS